MNSLVSLESDNDQLGTSVGEPRYFLQRLASQSEILACLRWLGEFQILACIPLSGSVPIKDVANLSGVPETHLGRVIRLTMTTGFLQESQAGHVAHTALSAPFVANLSLLDAAMFIAESAAPTALQMAQATQRFGDSHRPNESAYNLALDTAKPFHTAREERVKLNRQWFAYLHYAGGLHAADNIAEILAQFDLDSTPASITGPSVVEVSARSTLAARAVAAQYPALDILVQICDPTFANLADAELSPRIAVTHRAPGTRQNAVAAAVYILHLPSPSLPSPHISSPPSAILAELQAHLTILRAGPGTLLILTAHLLPEPGSISDPGFEAVARSRDLILRQLANEGEVEMIELLDMIGTVRDSLGGLVVTNKLRSHNNLVVALVVKYQLYAERELDLQVA
ncbi:MAG: hypothetical protein M1821_000271 [Bathelium mastoideum]|nr:MAG: hypothetical protein M1821_000271 [Bathelium mastoideum]